MARRWRIRHKLFLGLAAAIAILGLLLAGTLNGLWSYYVTMKGIESKLGELDEAEKLKSAVAALQLPSGQPRGLPRSSPHEALYLLDKKARAADRRLTEFEDAFKDTLRRKLSTDDGSMVAGQIEELRQQLSRLSGLCQQQLDGGATMGGGAPPIPAPVRNQIEGVIQELEQTSRDLRSVVREGLRSRINHSRRHYQITLSVLIGVSVLSIVLMISVLRYFYNWIYTPIRNLQEGVSHVADGSFDHRIEVNSSDEMEELAAAFNDMSYRLNELYRDLERQVNERSRQLVRSERLASVGFLAAGVAHEINNPLASIAFCSEALDARLDEISSHLRRTGRDDGDFQIFSKYLKMIQEEAFRCKNITERLLEFSRGGERKRERSDLVELIRAVIEVARVHQNCKGKEIVFAPPEHIFAWINVDEIKQVVLNLVVNALENMDGGGTLQIDLGQREGMAELSFTDTGCGMTSEVLEYIFEPFFTQNRSGKGTGLGLTITHRIVSQHGGEIEATSPGTDQGSTFLVRLPLQPVESVKEEALDNAAA